MATASSSRPRRIWLAATISCEADHFCVAIILRELSAERPARYTA